MPLPLSVVAPVAFDVNGLGTDSFRTFRIAILSEGFLPSEMPAFRTAVADIVKEINATQPFKRRRNRLHIVRIECTSLVSATTLTPLAPPPAGYLGSTPFDVVFNPIIRRELSGSTAAVRAVVRAIPGLPRINALLALVNNRASAGTAPEDVAWLTLADPAPTFVHELGHAGFGLDDEYEIHTGAPGELPATFSGSEPVAPNVTKQDTRVTIPWTGFFRPSTVSIPTTTGPCRFNHPIVAGTPSDAVGLFEGAAQHACGVFRPSVTCKMREPGDFCAICEHTILGRLSGAVLSGRDPFIVRGVLPWTHTAPVPPTLSDPDRFDIGAYNTKTGLFAMYFANEFEGNISPAGVPRALTQLDAGFTTVAAFSAGNEQFVYADSAFTHARAIFQIDRQNMVVPGNPALIARFTTPPQPAPPFGFSHMLPIGVGGQTFLLHYDRITGDVELEVFNPLTRTPAPLASTKAGSLGSFRKFLSTLTSVTVNGIPHLVGIDATNRVVVFARLELTAFAVQLKEVLVLNGVILPFQTHALGFELHNMPIVLTYDAPGGSASLYEVRTNLSGLDHIVGWPAGPGASAFFDVGLPAFGFMPPFNQGSTPPVPSGGVGKVGRLWFYNAGWQRFTTFSFH
jgi:hypothetical protein